MRTSVFAATMLAVLACAAQDSASLKHADGLFREHEYRDAAREYETLAGASAASYPLLPAAKAWVNAHQYKAAELDLQRYLTGHPQSDDAHYLLAFVYFRENRPKESLQQSTRAAAIREPSADDLKIVALDYSLLDDLASAAKYLQIAIQKDPNNREVLYHLGRIRYIQNQFADATALFSRILAVHPDDVKALTNLGLAYEAQGKSADAAGLYNRAIRAQKGSSSQSERPYFELGRLLLAQGKSSEAKPLLARSVEVNGNCAECLMELGKCEMELADLPNARLNLERSVSVDETRASSHYALARLYKRLHLSELAKKELARTEELNRSRTKPNVN